ncbi:MAG: undecaprenyl-diphosphate phosphatase [Lachnospiraceae bacterium]|nr:undecaprenyl-diphosphate phosphatase [Lachnospiraceae bacterium]MDE6982145.1 undecaprenyl-diphosphate phosphatase [Lachnospiraceae bacterium]
MEGVMAELLKALFFGIVEGITEWLPISSTGHLILLNEFVTMDVSQEFFSMFEVVIQFGAILAVVMLYFKDIYPFSKGEPYFIKKDIFLMWLKIAFACVPAVILELLFGDVVEEMFYNPFVIALALILFGAAFIWIENRNKRKEPRVKDISDITFSMALGIGMFQLIAAVFPGTSRSGATILGGILLGISRSVAAEFTFFLAIPVMLGASLIKLLEFGLSFQGGELGILLVGMSSAFFVSAFVIRFLMAYIKGHDFKVFGWYRIVLGILVLIYFAL